MRASPEVFSVAGRYDLVAILRVRDSEAMANLVTDEMLQVDGITGLGNHDRIQGLFAP
ncbi:MAG: Lrp/AsnC ligand binding domain-containing protein [Caldilineaceae bacterium]